MLGRVWRAMMTAVYFLELRVRGVENTSVPGLRGKKPRIRNAGTMRIGHNLRVLGRVTRTQFSTGPAGVLTFGTNVGINEGVSIHAEHEVTIGDEVLIADFVSIADTDFHQMGPGDGIRSGPVHIERNVWLGRNVIVLCGVRIGMNSIIAAGSVVTSDVPPNTVAGGNPARVIRELEIADPERFVRRR
jgi:acetyltransferase-like isoleucine patch superfamily enzyme